MTNMSQMYERIQELRQSPGSLTTSLNEILGDSHIFPFVAIHLGDSGKIEGIVRGARVKKMGTDESS